MLACTPSSVAAGNVFVSGLREVQVNSVPEAMALVKQAQRARAVADTKVNARSSRSHAVFTLKLVSVSARHACVRITLARV